MTVLDTAGNVGPSYTPDIGVDTVPPKVTASISGTTVTLNVSDSSDGGSGLWKPNNGIPTGVNKIQQQALFSIVYDQNLIKQGLNLALLVSAHQTISITITAMRQAWLWSQTFSVDIGNATGNIVAYCIEDNAWNVTRGVYPSDPVGCFSSTNMNLFQPSRPTRLPSNSCNSKPVWLLSLRKCYQLPASVVSSQTISQRSSRTSTMQVMPILSTGLLQQHSRIPTPNTNGYYYFSNIAGNTLSINNTQLVLDQKQSSSEEISKSIQTLTTLVQTRLSSS